MKIGLYFGTFNPMHVGHLIIANHVVEHTDLDQVWMVVTPQNPLKKKSTLLDDYHRLHMVHLATENYPKLKASDMEFKLPQPNYTINTLVYLEEKYANYEFALIMGEDNLNSLHKWKNYEMILKNYSLYVYPRLETKDLVADGMVNGTDNFHYQSYPKINMINAPVVEISSTFIRESIKTNKNVQPLLPPKVWEYIDHNNFYKK